VKTKQKSTAQCRLSAYEEFWQANNALNDSDIKAFEVNTCAYGRATRRLLTDPEITREQALEIARWFADEHFQDLVPNWKPLDVLSA
jgi:hypothetical protein